MKAIIKEIKNESAIVSIIENICIVEHGFSYGVNGNYEYLELWKNSVRPYVIVKLDGKTEITLK